MLSASGRRHADTARTGRRRCPWTDVGGLAGEVVCPDSGRARHSRRPRSRAIAPAPAVLAPGLVRCDVLGLDNVRLRSRPFARRTLGREAPPPCDRGRGPGGTRPDPAPGVVDPRRTRDQSLSGTARMHSREQATAADGAVVVGEVPGGELAGTKLADAVFFSGSASRKESQ